MSYSIEEGIEDEARLLAAMKATRERYPQASMSNGRWYAGGVGSDATDLKAEGEIVHAVVNVEGMYVYDYWRSMTASQLIWTIKATRPELYRQLVDVVARRGKSE